jgi:hypothetical protein
VTGQILCARAHGDGTSAAHGENDDVRPDRIVGRHCPPVDIIQQPERPRDRAELDVRSEPVGEFGENPHGMGPGVHVVISDQDTNASH